MVKNPENIWSLEKYATAQDPYGLDVEASFLSIGSDPKSGIVTEVHGFNGIFERRRRRVDTAENSFRIITKTFGEPEYGRPYSLVNPYPYDSIRFGGREESWQTYLEISSEIKPGFRERYLERLDRGDDRVPKKIPVCLRVELGASRQIHELSYKLRAYYDLVTRKKRGRVVAPLGRIEFITTPTVVIVDNRSFPVDHFPYNDPLEHYLSKFPIASNINRVQSLLEDPDHRDDMGFTSYSDPNKKKRARLSKETGRIFETIEGTELTLEQLQNLGTRIGTKIALEGNCDPSNPERIIDYANFYLARTLASRYRYLAENSGKRMGFENIGGQEWEIFCQEPYRPDMEWGRGEKINTMNLNSSFTDNGVHYSLGQPHTNREKIQALGKTRALLAAIFFNDIDLVQLEVDGLRRPYRQARFTVPLSVSCADLENLGAEPESSSRWRMILEAFPFNFELRES